MQMDSLSLRILRANLVEVAELHREAVRGGQLNYASQLVDVMRVRKERYDRGIFFDGSSEGTETDSV